MADIAYKTTGTDGNVVFLDGTFSHAGEKFFLRFDGSKYLLWEGMPSFTVLENGGTTASEFKFAGVCSSEPYFTDGNLVLWRGKITNAGYPREPEQWQGYELYFDENSAQRIREVTAGDTYWQCDNFTAWGTSEAYEFTCFPTSFDSYSTIRISRDFAKIYTCDTLLGIYERLDGGGKKLVGVPVWTDENGREFKRISTGMTGVYTYGDIAFNAVSDTWILGDIGTDSGWWQSVDEPSLLEPVTFVFCRNEDSDAVGENFTLTFSHCLATEKTEVLFAEVAKWL